MASRGKGSHTKGQGYERYIAKKFAEWYKCAFHRVPLSGGLKWGANLKTHGDIVCDDPVFPFTIECKCQEKWRFESIFVNKDRLMGKWWLQALDQASKIKKEPILIFTKNNSPDFIRMRVVVFQRLGLCIPHLIDMDGVIFCLDEFLSIPKERILECLWHM